MNSKIKKFLLSHLSYFGSAVKRDDVDHFLKNEPGIKTIQDFMSWGSQGTPFGENSTTRALLLRYAQALEAQEYHIANKVKYFEWDYPGGWLPGTIIDVDVDGREFGRIGSDRITNPWDESETLYYVKPDNGTDPRWLDEQNIMQYEQNTTQKFHFPV